MTKGIETKAAEKVEIVSNNWTSVAPDSGSQIHDAAEIIDAETAAKFLRMTKSELECRAQNQLPPQFISRHPLTYLSEVLVDYACDMWLSNIKNNELRDRNAATQSVHEGNLTGQPKLVRMASKLDYQLFFRSVEDQIANPATHAVTISFNLHGTDFAGMTAQQFNGIVGPRLRTDSKKAMARTFRRFAGIHDLYGHRARTNYPFWLQGERYTKHGLNETHLHLHGRLFVEPTLLDEFTAKQLEFEMCLAESFRKYLCPVDILIEPDDGGYANYSLKHISNDVASTEWFVTNMMK